MIGNQEQARRALASSTFLSDNGLHFIVDGQYGSTGKGLAAGFIYDVLGHMIDGVTANAGPNSGHTSYFGDEKIVLTQLPTVGVHSAKNGTQIPMFINPGSVVDVEKMQEEAQKYGVNEDLVVVSQYAAKVTDEATEADKELIEKIGSTGKGTGAAIAAKVMRERSAVVGPTIPGDMKMSSQYRPRPDYENSRWLVEVSQGFSLGINQGFYPYTTSRECTVAQAMLDAGAHPYQVRETMMVVRTFPIRVGGNSGPCYADQDEISWEDLGIEPEYTTVTNKKRRVFTWSAMQYLDALMANRPTIVFLNFMNYLDEDVEFRNRWIHENVYKPYKTLFGQDPLILLGFGPKNEDVGVYFNDEV